MEKSILETFCAHKMKIWDSLEKDGCCIVRNVVATETLDVITSEFFDYIEAFQPGFQRNDISTWARVGLPLVHHGLMCLGTQKHAVHARTACKPVFDSLFNTKDLLCSFEGTHFNPPPRRVNTCGDIWYNPLNLQMVETRNIYSLRNDMIQGILNLEDQTEESSLFYVLPKSHLFHEELLLLKDDSVYLNPDMKDYLDYKGIRPQGVVLNRGDILLWQPHLVVGKGKASIKSSRYSLQVQMTFGLRRDNHQQLKRTKYFQQARTTLHSLRPLPPDRSLRKPFPLTDDEVRYHGLI